MILVLVNFACAISEPELKDFLRTEMSNYFQKQDTSLNLVELKQTLNFYFTLEAGLREINFLDSRLSDRVITIITDYVEEAKSSGEFFSCILTGSGEEVIKIKKWWEFWKIGDSTEQRKVEQDYIFSLKRGEVKNLGKINIVPKSEKEGKIKNIKYEISCDSEIEGYIVDNYIYASSS